MPDKISTQFPGVRYVELQRMFEGRPDRSWFARVQPKGMPRKELHVGKLSEGMTAETADEARLLIQGMIDDGRLYGEAFHLYKTGGAMAKVADLARCTAPYRRLTDWLIATGQTWDPSDRRNMEKVASKYRIRGLRCVRFAPEGETVPRSHVIVEPVSERMLDLTRKITAAERDSIRRRANKLSFEELKVYDAVRYPEKAARREAAAAEMADAAYATGDLVEFLLPEGLDECLELLGTLVAHIQKIRTEEIIAEPPPPPPPETPQQKRLREISEQQTKLTQEREELLKEAHEYPA